MSDRNMPVAAAGVSGAVEVAAGGPKRVHLELGGKAPVVIFDDADVAAAAEAGVDCFVAGSAVYSAADPAAAIVKLREQAAAASPHLSL